MNGFLNNNRSAILQLYDPSFFQTMRSMGDVLEIPLEDGLEKRIINDEKEEKQK